jgi:hypothetical protein
MIVPFYKFFRRIGIPENLEGSGKFEIANYLKESPSGFHYFFFVIDHDSGS